MKKVKDLSKKKTKNNLTGTDNSMVITRSKGGKGRQEKVKGGYVVTKGDSTLGGKHTIQYTDDISQNCTPESYVILLMNVTPTNAIKILKKNKK